MSCLAFFAMLVLGSGVDPLFGGGDRSRGLLTSGAGSFGWHVAALLFCLTFGSQFALGSSSSHATYVALQA